MFVVFSARVYNRNRLAIVEFLPASSVGNKFSIMTFSLT